jgi:hypothetical protein
MVRDAEATIDFVTPMSTERWAEATPEQLLVRDALLPEDKLQQMAILDDAERIARRHGFRLVGGWQREDGCWSAPVATGPTPTRTVRIEDTLWEQAKRTATQHDTNVSAIIVEAVQSFVAGKS